MKKLIVSRDDARLQPLKTLIEKLNRKTLIMWCLECTESVLPIFEEQYTHDKRPREAVELAKKWSQGKIKMPIAKKAALASHNAASEVEKENPAASAAARAMGHVVGTVHVKTHAISFVIYTLTAFVYSTEHKESSEVITAKVKWLHERLTFWEKNIENIHSTWAPFLLKDDIK